MTYDVLGPGALDYLPCRYGKSKLLFRGPPRDLKKPYVAFIGGSETYGRFIKVPFPELIEQTSGMSCVNLGFQNAGVDAFVHDPFVLNAAGNADVTVLQVVGAHNLSNRFYSVHPRRNDRFVAASALLCSIYREVDFSEFHFNKHMLNDLIAKSPERFSAIRAELQKAWVARMQLLLRQIEGKVVVMWFASNAPPDGDDLSDESLGNDPLFVTQQMIDEIMPLADRYVEVVASPSALSGGTEGMFYGPMETLAAEQMLGPKAHMEAAEKIIKSINGLL